MRLHFLSFVGLLLLGSPFTGADVGCDDPCSSWISDTACLAPVDCCGSGTCTSAASCQDRWYLLPNGPHGIDIHGWLNGGFVGNTGSPDSKFNGPYNGVDRSNEGMLNQLYVVTEKVLPTCGMGFGARFDLLYGEDFYLAESIGMEKRQDGSAHWNSEYYGLALPQIYAAVGNQDLSLQIGHFYSIVGYEGVMSPDNFFYSKSYSYQFAGPFTHWGGQVNWNATDALSVQLGLVNGWDALDRDTDRINAIAKVKYVVPCSDAWTSFAIVTGDDFNSGAAGSPATRSSFINRTRYSWLVDLPLTCRLEYVFHH